MKRKTASEIFGPVDPGLTVVSGRRERRSGKRRTKKLSEAQQPELGANKFVYLHTPYILTAA